MSIRVCPDGMDNNLKITIRLKIAILNNNSYLFQAKQNKSVKNKNVDQIRDRKNDQVFTKFCLFHAVNLCIIQSQSTRCITKQSFVLWTIEILLIVKTI